MENHSFFKGLTVIMRPEKLFALFSPLDSLSGIGKKTAVLCEKLGIFKPVDLLFHLPAGLIDRRVKSCAADVPEGVYATLKVTALRHYPPFSKKSPYKIVCEDANGQPLNVVFFRAFGDYPQKALPAGEERLISGKIERFGATVQMTHPDYILPASQAESIPMLEPVYPLTAGVSSKILHKAAKEALSKVADYGEWIDEALKKREKFPDFKEALRLLHAPETNEDLARQPFARKRLAFDELLANQLALGLMRHKMRKVKGRAFVNADTLAGKVLSVLPFSLTGAQKRVIDEIRRDMAAPYRMLRLVQGDVGSGKTIVALAAMLKAAESGAQAALMAPTDILAVQHFEKLSALAQKAGVETVFLSGRTKGKKRAETLEKIASGQAKLIIGTHALFSDDVVFDNLGLTVVDEQHKFGVHQRLGLAQKGAATDMLVMTATPIPRTLALTYYGDMDVSRIDEMPAGRKPVLTRVLPDSRQGEIIEALKRTLAKGDKIYWICPLVEESEKSDMAAAQMRYDMLKKVFGDKVGLAHGKMKTDEKDAVMDAFAHGSVDILVATTVVEVGVDVPQATVMVIENAQRFGLAQLHQLRGRVGRGQKESACLLLYSGNLSDTAKARLSALRDTHDGFKIAEQDLTLRGAGEVLGVRQSGLPEFKMADLLADADLLKTASNDAKYILNIDENLTTARGERLRTLLYLFSKDDAVKNLKAG